MTRLRIFAMLCLWVLGCAPLALCQGEPTAVTVCELANSPGNFNHSVVEVTGFVSHDFEDFTIFDPTCASPPAIWLEYGGKIASGTTYCCGVTNARSRSTELSVETIPIPLVVDDRFRTFDKLIQPPFRSGRHGAIVRATIVGRFFSGKQMHYPKATFWGGYGHMGCCSLLAIEQIKMVNSEDRDDLDYGSSPDQPELTKEGCEFRFLTSPAGSPSQFIDEQRHAEFTQQEWLFDDSQRVATEAITRLANVDPQSLKPASQTMEGKGRAIYQWSQNAPSPVNYMVVVSRPYWLSFYARDPDRVVWVVIGAYESSCRK